MDSVARIEGSRRTLILVGLILGLFLAALEVTVVATAMPDVIEDLGGNHLYSLPFALYLLLATVSGPLWGYGSDLQGRRRLYMASVAIFLLGSALSGAAQSMGWLVAARALQGLGGGGLQTLTFTIIGELYPLEQRSRVQGWISAVWGISALLGPSIGGIIVDNVSWRWVFYINLPFGLAGAALVARHYTDLPRALARRLDLAGALLFSAGAGLLFYGLQVRSLALIGGGLALLAVFPLLERRVETPLVQLQSLGEPLLARSVLGNFLGAAAFFGITAYLPLFAQQARGMSATAGGALLSPTTLGWTVSSIIAARLLPRVGPRPIAQLGAAAMVAGFGLWAALLRGPIWLLGAIGLLVGLGMGSVMISLLISAQDRAPRQTLGSVTALILFARNVGGSLGSVLMATALGPALELGGANLRADFWRVPLLAGLLSLLLLAIVARLPNLGSGEPHGQATAER